jgi:protein Mpv17
MFPKLTTSQGPFTLNTLALLQFVAYGILVVPINFYWQRALEARYPGFPSRAEISNLWRSLSLKSLLSFAWLRSFISSILGTSTDNETLPIQKDKEKWAPARRSGLHSFLMKFFFDQTLAGAMNIVLFVVLINFLKGEGFGRVWELVLLVRVLLFASPRAPIRKRGNTDLIRISDRS